MVNIPKQLLSLWGIYFFTNDDLNRVFFCKNLNKIWGLPAVSTVVSQQQGPGFKSQSGLSALSLHVYNVVNGAEKKV